MTTSEQSTTPHVLQQSQRRTPLHDQLQSMKVESCQRQYKAKHDKETDKHFISTQIKNQNRVAKNYEQTQIWQFTSCISKKRFSPFQHLIRMHEKERRKESIPIPMYIARSMALRLLIS